MKKAFIAITLLVVFGACRHSSTAPMNSANQPTIITIGSSMFSPSTVNVRAGNLVYWKNNDRVTHRIVLDDRRYDSSDIAPGQIGCGLIVNDAGMHSYHDMNYPAMTGTITVTQ